MGVVHSSPDTDFVQEVKQLENETTDKEVHRSVEQKVKVKKLERDVAYLKWVSHTSNFPVDVVCCEVGLGGLHWGMW